MTTRRSLSRLARYLYVSTRDLVVDTDDEDGDIAKCGGRARRRVMRSGQHVRVALTIDTTLVLPSDAAFRCMYGCDTFNDGSGGIGGCIMAPASIWQFFPGVEVEELLLDAT